ncbi:hypothetical protein CA85_33470 [Allorhodopirellula solitaria]|uniref:Uncharacterized protein n=1 Tax=Allorhodopirellula solitaria TaxID=2527987 RepID=A0A5C5XTQ4_9BACT|nr:hypothetical protein CA85_33470 [Allorhodopirellula solitaria]
MGWIPDTELLITHMYSYAEGVEENNRWFERKRTPPDTTREARVNPEWGGRSFTTRSATRFGVDAPLPTINRRWRCADLWLFSIIPDGILMEIQQPVSSSNTTLISPVFLRPLSRSALSQGDAPHAKELRNDEQWRDGSPLPENTAAE